LCSVATGTHAVIAAATTHLDRNAPPPALDSIGLGAELAQLLQQK
jgi:hypothetical protein